MRISALDLLACPACKEALTLATGSAEPDGHVLAGEIACTGCGRRYPIIEGVPRLLPLSSSGSQSTAQRFGKQWKTFTRMADYQQQKLRQWLDPVGPEHFRDKLVYEAGCGKGRHTVVGAEWGARQLVALDLSEAVDVAFHHSRHASNVVVVQGDLLNPPVRPVFDLAFSVGVLHHLPNPRAGFNAVAGVLRDGGRIAAWVYGYESNEWVVRYVDPLRKNVTSKLPTKLLYWLSLAPAVGLNAASRLYTRERLARRLPMKGYMQWLQTLPLHEVHNIVFDQLTPPIAFYLPEQEVRSWFDGPGFEDVLIRPFRDNSWRATAVVRSNVSEKAREQLAS